MNQDQVISLIRTILKIAGGALAAHGLTNAASWINGEDVTGLVLAIAGIICSHYSHAADPASPANSGAPKLGLWFLMGCLAFGSIGLTGCQTTPAGKALAVENGTHVTVEAAMSAWGAYVKQFHPPVEQERAVNAAWLKYQKAMVAAIDATKVVVTLAGTDAPTAPPDVQSKMSDAMAEAVGDLGDLVALLRQFGVKI